MQLLSNKDQLAPNDPYRKRKILLVAGVVVFVSLILLATLLVKDNQKNADFKGETVDRFDKNSGDTVSDPNDKTPDVYGNLEGVPLFLGFDNLIKNGMTLDQLNTLKFAFYQYNNTVSPKAKEISLTLASINPIPHDRFSTSIGDQIKFNLVMDQKTTVSASVDYWDFTTIHLFLYDKAGTKLLYDSGELKGKNLEKL